MNIRVLAATNQDLQEKIRAGSFRRDLYYRLAAVEIAVPPLRERPEDIAVLARHLLRRFGRDLRKPGCYLAPSALAALEAYTWPGNVRELRNVMERAVMFAKTDAITGADIQALLPAAKGEQALIHVSGSVEVPYIQAKKKVVAEFTSAYLRTKLAMHNGLISKAADSSGIPRQYFSLLMKRYLDQDGEKA